MWVRVIRESIETHMFEEIEYKEEGGGGGSVESDAHETTIHETT